jgi:hypothetical protein
MSRRAQILVIVVFLTVITTPMLLFVAGVRPENTENRTLTPLPELRADNALRLEAYELVTGYLTDRLPLRDHAIRADAQIEDAVTLTDPVSSDLPRGSDGWLFIPSTLTDECPGPPPEAFLEQVDPLAADADAAGLPLLFVVPPNKASVHPEHLPVEGLAGLLGLDRPDLPECERLWRDTLDTAAADRPWLLPLVSAIDSASDDPDDPVFWKTDTHWTDRGSSFQAAEVLGALAPGTWSAAEIRPDSPRVKEVTDLSYLRGLPVREEVPGYLPVRDGVTTTTRSFGEGPFDPGNIVKVAASTSTDAPLVPGTTVMVGDSFGNHGLRMIQPYFERFVFVPWQMLVEGDLASALGRAGVTPAEVDALVVEQVQRNLSDGAYERFVDELRTFVQSTG